MTLNLLQYLFLFLSSLILGACIGSFLGAASYRIPNGIPLYRPKRSQCPSCDNVIPAKYNIPVVSYLFLKGKCACPKKVNLLPDYLICEALTALLFAATFLKWGATPMTLLVWVISSLWMLGAMIDIKEQWLPDRTTIGAAICIIAFYTLFPTFAPKSPLNISLPPHLGGLTSSLIWATITALGMWLILEGGKLAFGRKSFSTKNQTVEIRKQKTGTYEIQVDDETAGENELLPRDSDKVILLGSKMQVMLDGEATPLLAQKATFSKTTVVLETKSGIQTLPKTRFLKLYGTVEKITSPREAMGFGDVKLMAAIGGLIGGIGAVHALVYAAFIGLAIAAFSYIKNKEVTDRLAFGPPLMLGTLFYLFFQT
jgi:prepilin signal peptidase PulO-like enzyme (type II secretory pathway)